MFPVFDTISSLFSSLFFSFFRSIDQTSMRYKSSSVNDYSFEHRSFSSFSSVTCPLSFLFFLFCHLLTSRVQVTSVDPRSSLNDAGILYIDVKKKSERKKERKRKKKISVENERKMRDVRSASVLEH